MTAEEAFQIAFLVLSSAIAAFGINRGTISSSMGASVSRGEKPELFWFTAATRLLDCALSEAPEH